MAEDGDEAARWVQRAIGGDPRAISWIEAHADTTEEPMVVAMAGLFGRDHGLINQALALATTSRDRQLIVIASAHLRGDHRLVDALARDHLADYPDSVVVAWIAADAAGRERGADA